MSARATVCLLGLRAAGKSSVGRAAASLLGRPFVDLDERLVVEARRAGVHAASAGELLRLAGEARFRDFESAALRSLLEPGQKLVVATGGGVVERDDARVWLRRAGRCVWLDAPPAVLAERLRADDTERPPLLGAG